MDIFSKKIISAKKRQNENKMKNNNINNKKIKDKKNKKDQIHKKEEIPEDAYIDGLSFTAKSGGTYILAISKNDVTTFAKVNVTADSFRLIDSFENETFTFDEYPDEVGGNASLSKEQVFDGETSVKLEYDFDRDIQIRGAYIVLNEEAIIPEEATHISFYVYNDGYKDEMIKVKWKDANDQTKLAVIQDNISHEGWQEIKYDVKYYGPNGALVKKERIKYGQYASSAAYDISGYKFIDWYTSTSYQSLFNFNNPITGETNIYGKYATKKTGSYSANLSAGTYKVNCTGELVGKIEITTYYYITQTSAPKQSSSYTLSNGDTFTFYYNSSVSYSYYYCGTSSNITITEMPKSTSGKFGTYSAGTYKVSCTGNVSGTIKITLDYNIPGGGVHRTEDIYVSNNGRFTIPYDSTYCTYSYSYTGSSGSISISKV